MKTYILTFLITLQYALMSAQSFSEDNSLAVLDDPSSTSRRYTHTVRHHAKTPKKTITKEEIGTNGFSFNMIDAGVNSKFSEFASGFFRNKFIMVSSKKIGGLDKIDKNTNEAYKNIFCVDVKKNGTLKNPLLFSRILNTVHNEGQVSFSPNEHVVYFTRSKKKNSLNYKLYKAELKRNSHGNWTNSTLVIGSDNYSVEHPFVSPDGSKLYFSSNKPGGFGGFDLYVANIKVDGSIGQPVNLGNVINTAKDEKYPSLSNDNKKLYFSSNGHKTIGGFDVFVSKSVRNSFKAPKNLGNTINTIYDELAFRLDRNENTGYVSTNPKGKFDIQKFDFELLDIIQSLEGTVTDAKTKTPLTNTTVILLDENNNELDVAITDKNANYQFDVEPSGNYTIKTEKNGFKTASFNFKSTINTKTTYTKNLELEETKPIIKTIKDKKVISIENIYFDYNKWDIKLASKLSLNKIYDVLNEYPEMRIQINAHTDNVGGQEFNKELSQRRAKSAKAYLTIKGISAERIKSFGFGESQPLINCGNDCSEQDNIANRRIEFEILNN